MIGTTLLLLCCAAGAWLTWQSIKIKDEEKQALLKRYMTTEEWLKQKNTHVEVITSAKQAWIEQQMTIHVKKSKDKS